MSNLFMNTKLGILEIICSDQELLEINIVLQKSMEKPNKICLETEKQIKEYLNKERRTFNLPIKLTGSEFQKTVWNELINISYGTTISYLNLATKIGNPKGVRAVANAVGANKILIIVPCHRVIGSNNTLTGFGGGLNNKIELLNLENIKVLKNRDLKKSKIIKV